MARDDQLLAEVLRQLDAGVHVQPYALRPVLGEALDGLKASALRGTADPAAQAVAQVRLLGARPFSMIWKYKLAA